MSMSNSKQTREQLLKAAGWVKLPHEAILGLECAAGHFGGQCSKCRFCREWIRPENLQQECPARKFKPSQPKLSGVKEPVR